MEFLDFLKRIILDEKRGLLHLYAKKQDVSSEISEKIDKKDIVLNIKRIVLFSIVIFVVEVLNLSTIIITNAEPQLQEAYLLAGGGMLLLTAGSVILGYQGLNKQTVSMQYHYFIYRGYWIIFSMLMLAFVYLELLSQGSSNNFIFLLILTATFPILSFKEATSLFLLDVVVMSAVVISLGFSPRQLVQFPLVAFFAWVLSRMLYNSHRTNDIMLEQLEFANERLNALAKTDSLTGLLNRRGIELHLQNLLTVLDNPIRVAFLMVDIDLFKSYNDNFGHNQGDFCLSLIAQAINASTQKQNEYAARYGGEEFLIVIIDCDENEALEVAKQIRKEIFKLKLEAASDIVNRYVTASIGVATAQTPLDFILLYEHADAELYRAKNNGRNCVSMSGNIYID